MDKIFFNDVFQWDVINWSKSLKVWQLEKTQNGKAAGFGEREGGLSLLLAKNGYEVNCTDFNLPEKQPFELHQQYNVTEKISYQKEDITNISFEDHSFDIVVFKSVIGALNDKNKQIKAIQELHRILKPGGQLLFAENLEGSFLHKFARKRFTNWGNRWRYISTKEINEFLTDFSKFEMDTFGFFATFGRSEKQRSILSKVDAFFRPIIPKSKRYIAAIRAIK